MIMVGQDENAIAADDGGAISALRNVLPLASFPQEFSQPHIAFPS